MVRDLLEFSQSDTEQLSARVTSFDLIGLQCRRECESALWLCDVTYKYSLFFRALTKGSHSAVTSLIFNSKPSGLDLHRTVFQKCTKNMSLEIKKILRSNSCVYVY